MFSNFYKKNIYIFIQLILFISSFSFYYSNKWPDQELIVYSPAIIFSLLYLLRAFCWLIIKPYLILSLLILSTIIIFNQNQEVKDLFRFLFVIGGVASVRYIKLTGNTAYYPFLIFFLIEFSLRVIHGTYEELNLYSLKGTYFLFFDSNFVGLFILSAMCGMIVSNFHINNKFKFSILGILLLLTFSRTSIIILLSFIFLNYFKKIGFLFLLIVALFPFYVNYYGIDLSLVDGSFGSKQLIFQSFFYLLNNNIEAILWGIGRDNAIELAIDVTSTSYSGHTIYGHIVQFGLIQYLIFLVVPFYIARNYVKNIFPFFISLLIGGFIGLSPVSYLGSLLLVYFVFQRYTIYR